MVALASLIGALAICACANGGADTKAPQRGAATPALWPQPPIPFSRDEALEARIDALMAQMTLEAKVGQVIQADSNSITPEDLKRYKLGSVLHGGNSGPDGKAYGTAEEWLAFLDAFYAAAMSPASEGPVIPPLFGIDAVHGHNNVVGAVLFPHNIGLGAARDASLVGEIARATALQLSATGHDWTFAPTLAVPQDPRWGRAYEGFSERPEIARDYAAAIVLGLQGEPAREGFLGAGRVVSSAKHFVGDGGTTRGVDQGDAEADEITLRDVHAAGYPPAISAGVQTVMASFSSWQGVKHHGNASLLTGVLKDRMGFDGFVVGDWNGHGQIPGCKNDDCPAALNAGLDMYMAPDSWRVLYSTTLAHAKSGAISQRRLDDAVRRILRVKLRAGLFEKGAPSTRPLAGRTELLSSPELQALARRAVRQSLVLLKNENGALPIRPGAHVLVAGDGADNIAKQSGGWTLTWQGAGLANSEFPNATSIVAGLREAVAAAGGTLVHDTQGTTKRKPDVAIFVYGENPYAEFQGDQPSLDFAGRDSKMLARMESLRAEGVRVVSVFLSGRPLWTNPELNASDAFVAAFLPGSEGGGIADVLVSRGDGTLAHDFTGALSFTWPAKAAALDGATAAPVYEPLFAYGYGLSYARPGAVGVLPTDSGLGGAGADNRKTYFEAGRAVAPFRLEAVDASGAAAADGPAATSPGGAVGIRAVGRRLQDDARRIEWSGDGSARIAAPAGIDLSRETNGDMALRIEARADAVGAGPLRIRMECGAGCGGAFDATALFAAATAEYRTISVNLRCFAGADMSRIDAPLVLDAGAGWAVSLSDARLVEDPADEARCD